MKIIKQINENYKYAIVAQYSESFVLYCKNLKDTFGFKEFGWNEKLWRFNNIRLAFKLKKDYPECELDEDTRSDMLVYKDYVQNKEKFEQEINNVKQLKDIELDIPNFKLNLFPYQKVAVKFLEITKGRALISLPPGLGKTPISLAYAVRGNYKTLVICPATLKPNWESEVHKFTDKKACIISSKTKVDKEFLTLYDVYIINYDILKKWVDILLTVRFELCILDESQAVKNPQAQRTKNSQKLTKNIPRIILLSASPFMNKPIELYTSLNIIDPVNWFNYYDYAKRYCDGKYNYFGQFEANGATNLEELRDKIQPIFYRKQREEVLDQIPDKIFSTITSDLDKEEREQYEGVVKKINAVSNSLRGVGNDFALKKALTMKRFALMGELRQITAISKIKSTSEMIENIIESGEKVVVFSDYHNPLHALYEKFKDCAVILTGDSSEKQRKESVEKFQNDPNVLVFLGGTNSASTGITLTAAHNIIIESLPYRPEDVVQMIGRIDRVNQKSNKLNIYFMVANDSVDEKMVQMLQRKSNAFNAVINGGEVVKANEDMMNTLLNIIEDEGTI